MGVIVAALEQAPQLALRLGDVPSEGLGVALSVDPVAQAPAILAALVDSAVSVIALADSRGVGAHRGVSCPLKVSSTIAVTSFARSRRKGCAIIASTMTAGAVARLPWNS